jgi:hypothetical protein
VVTELLTLPNVIDILLLEGAVMRLAGKVEFGTGMGPSRGSDWIGSRKGTFDMAELVV